MRTRLKGTGIDRDVRGKDNASDHAPVWVELGRPQADAAPRAKRSSR
jgi:exodeoxyribonuclease-3